MVLLYTGGMPGVACGIGQVDLGNWFARRSRATWTV